MPLIYTTTLGICGWCVTDDKNYILDIAFRALKLSRDEERKEHIHTCTLTGHKGNINERIDSQHIISFVESRDR